MSSIDLEAIRARALEVITDIDHGLVPKARVAQQAYDVDELLGEVRRLRERLTITEEMIEIAKKGVRAVATDGFGFLNSEDEDGLDGDGALDYEELARAALEAALEGDNE